MTESDLSDLVRGTADIAFGVTPEGFIRVWNDAASEFFGFSMAEMIGSRCTERICHISDECPECPVLRRAADSAAIPAFDAQVQCAHGTHWVNLSIVVARLRQGCCILHLARDIEQRKNVEQLARTFLTQVGALTGLDVEQLLSSSAGMPHADLTVQERKVLRLMVDGMRTREISEAMGVSPATVRNHIEHVLQKLSSHSRVQAVLRAIREKLV